MRVLHSHHILPLFVWVDDAVASLPKTEKAIRQQGGRPATLRDSEVVTILVFNLLTVQQHTLRQIYDWIGQYHAADFPHLPSYQNFVAHCHRVYPVLRKLLRSLLKDRAALRFMDATMLPVCKLVRRRWHRVARDVAHTGYRSKPLHKKIRRAFGTFILTPPHYKQQTQLMTESQHKLLRRRPKIETVFDYLKEHLHLVTSFPRSVHGYAVHYTRILLGYQLLMLGW